MGQFASKDTKHRHVKKIIDKVYDKITTASGEEELTLQDLYTAILLVYSDVNKYLPGPYHDPPSREEVEALMKEVDSTGNGVLNREEFAALLEKFTHTMYHGVTRAFVLYAAAPLLAMGARMASEQVPRLGPVVRRIPNFAYNTLVTSLVAMYHSQK